MKSVEIKSKCGTTMEILSFDPVSELFFCFCPFLKNNFSIHYSAIDIDEEKLDTLKEEMTNKTNLQRLPVGSCLAVSNLIDRTIRYTTTGKTFSIDVLESDYGNKSKANNLITLHSVSCARKASFEEFLSMITNDYYGDSLCQKFVYLYISGQGWTTLYRPRCSLLDMNVVHKKSPVTEYVISRLNKIAPGFLLYPKDFKWLLELNRCHGKTKITNESLVSAMRKALPKGTEKYSKKYDKFRAMIDPWELLIEAGICDEHTIATKNL